MKIKFLIFTLPSITPISIGDDDDSIFDQIKEFTPQINNSWKSLYNSDFRIDELDAAIGKMSMNKSPGTDGLTANFYQHLLIDIREILFKVIKECLENDELTASMRRG